jgi:hypothetical protein
MIQKITSPNYLGVIAPLIMKFYNRIKETSGLYEGVTYESLFVYLTRLIQFGRNGTGEDRSEVWVAYEDETPIGFAAWHLMDIPHIGKVFCPCLYNDTRNQKAIKELYGEFIQFGRKHRAPIYEFYAVNEKVGEYFKNVLGKLGVEANDTGAREYIGREK